MPSWLDAYILSFVAWRLFFLRKGFVFCHTCIFPSPLRIWEVLALKDTLQFVVVGDKILSCSAIARKRCILLFCFRSISLVAALRWRCGPVHLRWSSFAFWSKNVHFVNVTSEVPYPSSLFLVSWPYKVRKLIELWLLMLPPTARDGCYCGVVGVLLLEEEYEMWVFIGYFLLGDLSWKSVGDGFQADLLLSFFLEAEGKRYQVDKIKEKATPTRA